MLIDALPSLLLFFLAISSYCLPSRESSLPRSDLLEDPVPRNRHSHESHDDIRKLTHCASESLLPRPAVDGLGAPPVVEIPAS